MCANILHAQGPEKPPPVTAKHFDKRTEKNKLFLDNGKERWINLAKLPPNLTLVRASEGRQRQIRHFAKNESALY
jgi:hypothetical protein